MRSARRASSGSWVARTTATPADRAATTTPATAAQVSRSWPTVGSSRTSTAGPWATAPARASRRISPPESRWGSVPARGASPRTSSSASARRPAASWSSPSRRLVLSTSSRTVRETTASSACCGTQPTRRASSEEVHLPGEAPAPPASQSAATTAPLVGASTPASRAVSVDFPAPLVPTTASTSPARTPTSTPQSAGTGGSGARAAVRPTAGRRTTPTASVWTANPDPCPGSAGSAGGSGTGDAGRTTGATSAVGTARGAGASTPGTQTPWAASSAARAASVGTTGPSAATRPAAVEDDQPVHLAGPRLEPVLDQHHGGSGSAHGVGDRPAYGRGGGGVQHRRGLVEQDEVRTQREHPGEREALRLPAGERPDRVVDVVREARPRRARPGPSPRSGPAAARGSRGRTPRPGRPARRPRRRPGPARAGPRRRRRRRGRARRP